MFNNKINIGFTGFIESNLKIFRKPRAATKYDTMTILVLQWKTAKINWTPNVAVFILYHFSEKFSGDNRRQKYLLCQIFLKYFTKPAWGARTLKRKFRWLSKESIKPSTRLELRNDLKLTSTDNAKI